MSSFGGILVISGPIPILFFFFHEVVPFLLVLIGVVLRVGLAELTVRKRPSSVGGRILHALMAPGAGSQWQPAHVHQLHAHQLHAHLLLSGRGARAPSRRFPRTPVLLSPLPCPPSARPNTPSVPAPPPRRRAPRQPSPPAFPRVPSLPGSPREHHTFFLPPAPAIADVLKSVPGRAAHAHALRFAAHEVDARFLDNTLIAIYFACGDLRERTPSV
jgi:hypothetical protein